MTFDTDYIKSLTNLKFIWSLSILLLSCSYGQSQTRTIAKDSSMALLAFGFNYSFQAPQYDMAARFGNNSNLGFCFEGKTKNNWIFSAEGNIIFGGTIKIEDQIMVGLRDEGGGILNGAGEYADVNLEQRGFLTGLRGGYVLNALGPNVNSGIMLKVGFGFIQHKIQIRDLQNTIPQISGYYRKGYDRRVNGFYTSQFLGYKYYSSNKLVNFYAGIEFIQGFTRDARRYNFDLMMETNDKRRDDFIGFKFGWVIPLYKKLPNEYYFY